MNPTQQIRIALAGNPNSGKTSIFNAITGAHRRVGNYPGVTVEKKEGTCRYGEREIHVVDLPGTYSLTAYSMEEIVARDYLIDEAPDAVVCVVDSSNLERNLYLALQLKELGIPLVLSFNMIDVARSRGFDIDLKRMSRLLEVRIVATVGHKGHGIQQLLEATVEAATKSNGGQNIFIDYGKEVEDHLAVISEKLGKLYGHLPAHRRRWISLKLLENDKSIRARYNSVEIIEAADKGLAQLESSYGEEPEIIVAEAYRDAQKVKGEGDAKASALFAEAFGKDPQFWSDASPIHRLAESPAPMLLVCSSRSHDACDWADDFAEKVDESGGKATVLPIALAHMAINNDLGLPGAYTTAVDSFLKSLGLP